MEKKNSPAIEKGSNGIKELLYKFIPFWPLFLVTTILSAGYFYFKLKTSTPIYETSASILVKDEKKGQEDSKMEEVLNVFGSKKIVENELEILRSNSIVSEVVKSLKLYAPVFLEKGWRGTGTISAYTVSPVILEVANPDKIIWARKVYYSYSTTSNTVAVMGKNFRLNEWTESEWGTIRFINNPNYDPKAVIIAQEDKFYFSINLVTNTTKGIIGGLMVTPASKQSSVINMALKDAVPRRAENIINEIVVAYNNAAVDRKNHVAIKTLEFIENRLKHVSSELDSVESGIQQYRDKSGVVDIGEQSKLYLQSIESNDKQLNNMNLQLSALDEVERYLEAKSSQGNIVPSTFNISDPTLNTLLDKLYNSEAQYEKLKRTSGENNPTVLALKEEMNKTRPNILDNIRSQKKSISAGITYLQQSNGKYSSMLSSIPKKEKELVEVSRQHNIKNDIYSFLLQKREETAYSISSILPDCYLVSKPTTSPGPISPKKSFMALLAIIIPFGVSILIVSFKDIFNSRILYRSDIESLTRFPVIGELVHEKLKYNIVTEASERSFIVEQFRQIRTALKHQGTPPGNIKKILITSCVKGDGKSFVSSNLAMSLARSGKKVALLELDLHQPRVSEIIEAQKHLGITDFLQGNVRAEEIILPTSKHPNLFLIPAGNLAEEPSELLVNGRLEILINYLEKQFDWLVIDTAPFKALTDAFVIAAYCDLVVTIVRHKHTPVKLIERMDEDMSAQNINNVAIVFNGVRNRGFGKYSYGYGYGYGYDQKSSYNDYYKSKMKKVS